MRLPCQGGALLHPIADLNLTVTAGDDRGKEIAYLINTKDSSVHGPTLKSVDNIGGSRRLMWLEQS